MTFEFKDISTKYSVVTSLDGGSDHIVIVYEGPDYHRAVEVCNYWDEKQDTWLHVDQPAMDYMSVAMRKFEALEWYIWAKADRIARDWAPRSSEVGKCLTYRIPGNFIVDNAVE